MIRTSVDAYIATVTLDRPERLNILDAAALEELHSTFERLAGDPLVRAVIVTGAGEKAFAAGADITELAALDTETARKRARRGQEIFDRIERFDKPVLAAINGYALGGGCELALACHLRFAAEGARIGTPEVRLGLICGFGGTQRLPRLIGRARALELLLTGEPIDAAQAHQWGLVNRVVPLTDLMKTAREALNVILQNGPMAVRLTLEAVRTGSERPMAEAMEIEARLFAAVCGSEDMREGTRAFVEKRTPRFSGR